MSVTDLAVLAIIVIVYAIMAAAVLAVVARLVAARSVRVAACLAVMRGRPVVFGTTITNLSGETQLAPAPTLFAADLVDRSAGGDL